MKSLFLKSLIWFISVKVVLLFYYVENGIPVQDNENVQWQQVISPRVWNFPRDHGSHPEYRTEWWYFTGNLMDFTGNRYGYQLTFFRQGLQKKVIEGTNPWSVHNIYCAHFAITDINKNMLTMDERMSRAGPGLAGAVTEKMDVWLFNWKAYMIGNDIFLQAQTRDLLLKLHLTPRKPLVFHGDGGISKKGTKKGQASFYTSFTDIDTSGGIRITADSPFIAVRGTSWFDHEFGSSQLAVNQEGWDWFGLHLSDGRELMIYLLRHTDKTLNPESSGTMVEPDGSFRHINLSEISVTALDTWKSKKTGAIYPSSWKITIPSEQIEMTILPLVADQELDTSKTTGIIYWEGAVAGKGMSRGKSTSCEGYVELTGYAGSIGGIF